MMKIFFKGDLKNNLDSGIILKSLRKKLIYWANEKQDKCKLKWETGDFRFLQDKKEIN